MPALTSDTEFYSIINFYLFYIQTSPGAARRVKALLKFPFTRKNFETNLRGTRHIDDESNLDIL